MQILAIPLGVNLPYVNDVETEHLNAADYPCEAFVHKLVDALDSGEDELLLSDRVLETAWKRVCQSANCASGDFMQWHFKC